SNMGKLHLAVVVGLCAFAWRIYESMDMGRTVYNHGPGVCRQVHGVGKGSEDIELVRSEGIAFVSSGLVYMQPKRGAHVQGKMFLYDLNQKLGTDQLKAKELPIKGASFNQDKFHPHGLSHWVVNGVIRLYAINHDLEFKHTVEVFDYDPSGPALVHKKSLSNPLFVRPNGIVAVGPDQFILTNDGVSQTEFTNFLEILTGYKAGSVVFWDGKESHELLSGMGAPNGIAYDAKNSKLFLTEVNYRRIHAYDIAKDKKSVTHLSTINLFSTCDNLFLDSDGSVYSGCHPVIIQTAKSIGDCDGDATSPSQILRIKYDGDYKTADVTEPYANDGKEVSGSSVGVIYNNQMLIGTVCKGLLHCEIVDPSVL
ncbi:hypothetical protein PENTCL1PPCAC_21829, partial [Pristionchus entomophagus]